MSGAVRSVTAAALGSAMLAGCVPHAGAPARPQRAAARPVAMHPAVARPTSGPGYIVQPGDTFRAIADRFGVEMAALGAANGIAPPYLIRIGQRLAIPVRPRASAPPSPGPALAPGPAGAPRVAGAPRFDWPTDGAITADYGVAASGGANHGIDLAAYRGMAVRAAAAGTVIFAGREPERFGQLVVIDHGGGWASAYAYLGTLTVREGEAVRARERIATIGASGEARTPTLHFEIRQGNRPLDPRPYLPPRL